MKTVALDFDGVIHAYSKGWGDGYGRQFVPVFNARNYPNRFERDGLTPKAR